MIGAAFAGKTSNAASEAMLVANLKVIDGLTGEQILEKYRSDLEKNRIKREKEEAERKQVAQLKKEAQEFLDSNKFEDALSKYKALSEISSGVEVSKIGIENTTKAMNEFAEKMKLYG